MRYRTGGGDMNMDGRDGSDGYIPGPSVTEPARAVPVWGDWDVVVFGDGTGEAQLLYAFRMNGPSSIRIAAPEAPGEWKRLLGPETACIERSNPGTVVCMPRNSAALWVR